MSGGFINHFFILLFIVSCSSSKVSRGPASLYEAVSFKCEEQSLWPTHPQSLTKIEHDEELVSDTFEDSCGNRYRGYWQGEKLLGRTILEKVGAQFKGEYEVGPTRVVKLAEFQFLTDLEEGDGAKIQDLRYQAFLAGFRLKNRVFLR